MNLERDVNAKSRVVLLLYLCNLANGIVTLLSPTQNSWQWHQQQKKQHSYSLITHMHHVNVNITQSIAIRWNHS